jgi:AraC-like DNA-binding protein
VVIRKHTIAEGMRRPWLDLTIGWIFFTVLRVSKEALPSFISRRVVRGRYLFLDLDPPAATDLAVTCAGWEECSPGYEIARDGFPHLALEYIAAGQWELETRGRKWNIGPGSIFAYGHGIAYSLRALSGGGLGKYFVDLAGGSAHRLLSRTGLIGAVPGRVLHGRWIHDILDQLIETAHLRPRARNSVSRMLLALLLERIGEDLRTTPHFSHARQSYEHCRQYLADNYLRIHSLADAAKACGVSAPHLSRLFHRFDTELPKAFLTRLKINHAAELILRGRLPVKVAAAQVGFDDPYHFSRCFKRVHGVAPSLFGR